MHEAPLTQEVIDHGLAESESQTDGVSHQLTRHPYLVGGALLAGTGIAFAAVKLAQKGEVEKRGDTHRYRSDGH
jgi:hypothetical protein